MTGIQDACVINMLLTEDCVPTDLVTILPYALKSSLFDYLQISEQNLCHASYC